MFNPKKDRIWWGAVALLGLIYLANCFTPLRLSNDTIRYFRLMEQLEGTWPGPPAGYEEFLPYGYVYFLLALSKAGLLRALVICGCQLAYLAGSLYYACRLFGTAVSAARLIFFCLLSWVSIKYTVLPLAEMQFLFFSMCTLYWCRRYLASGRSRYGWWMLVFCGLAVLTRTAGIALVLSLGLAIGHHYRQALRQWVGRHRLLVGFSLLVLALVPVLGYLYYFSFRIYLQDLGGSFSRDTGRFLWTNFTGHLIDFGELFVNIPLSKSGPLLPAGWAKPLYMLVGAAFLALVLFRICSRRVALPMLVRIYLVVYLLMIFNWPYFDTRFWFPVLPLLVGLLLLPGVPLPGVARRWLAPAYGTLAVLSGIFVLGYYSWLSFDRDALARRQDAGIWQKEYEWYFSGRPADKRTGMDQDVLYILEKYQ